MSLLRGGGQERGLRAGTENTPLVRGLGTACRLVQERLAEDGRRMETLRDLLETKLLVGTGRVGILPGQKGFALAGGQN